MRQFVKKVGKWNVIGVAIIIFFIASAKLIEPSMFLWVRTLWWHVTENPVITYNGMRIKLPLRWSVIDNKDQSLALFAAPDYGKGPGEVFFVSNDIFNRKFPFENPDDWPTRGKLLNTTDVEHMGTNSKNIGGEQFVGIVYNGKDGKTYVLYPMKTKNSSIIARSSPDFEESMMEDLFSRVSFM